MLDYVRVLWLFSVFSIAIEATTHWLVTEDGLIQPRINSPFLMGKEYDLISFMNQDVRYENIVMGYQDLTKRAKSINNRWTMLEDNVDLKRHAKNDPNCVNSGPLNMLDWYTAILEDGHDRHLLRHEPLPDSRTEKDVPDCKKISSLTYSMAAFEHLDAMIQRENLTIKSEHWPPEQLNPSMTVDQYGHWLAGKLRQNSSSWVHYNMASLYWRMRGVAGKALECSRRAVHYSPRRFKDIPLLSMGTIFHRAKMTEDAITVLSASIDHYSQCATTRFIIGNAYAVTGDYNNSLRQLATSLKLSPDFELARRHRCGVLCTQAAMERIDNIVKHIKAIQQELIEFRLLEARWTKSQTSFLMTMRHDHEFDFRNAYTNCKKLSEITGLDLEKLKAEADRNEVIQTMLDGSSYLEFWEKERGVHAIEAVYTLQKLMRNIENHLSMASMFGIHTRSDHLKVTDGQIRRESTGESELFDFLNDLDLKPKPSVTKDKEDDTYNFEGGVVLYPSNMRVSRSTEDFDRISETAWPSQRICAKVSQNPRNLDLVYPVFLPFENKGIRLRSLLTDMIGVPSRTEHDLPWHPPTCPLDKDAFSHKKSNKNIINVEVGPLDHLRAKLLEYVSDGDISSVKHMQDAEIGQRIYSAMELKKVPKWLVYTLASLYWRVRDNRANAINCLLAARNVPARHRDIVMTSLSSLYLEMGLFDDALNSAEDAFRGGVYEPAVNFLLAQLNMVKRHRNTQLFHLKQVVRVEPGFMGGLARKVLEGTACANRDKVDNEMQSEPATQDDQICTEVEAGVSMLCDANGSRCRVAALRCAERETHGKSQFTESDLLRMIEHEKLKYSVSSKQFLFQHIDTEPFEELLRNRPPPSATAREHRRHFKQLVAAGVGLMKGCGEIGCKELISEMIESESRLTEEECGYYHKKGEYWHQLIDFTELLSEGNRNFLDKVATELPPNTRMIPECNIQYNPDTDFFIEQPMLVDHFDWSPVNDMMYAFSETFFVMDSALLGAKLAQYIEKNPSDWLAHIAGGWWCGLSGRGACAVRCLASAMALRSPRANPAPLIALTALLHMNGKFKCAKDMAYLMFYLQPKSKLESFLVAVSHTYLEEYEQAIWMYRYILNSNSDFKLAQDCFHSTICALLFGKSDKKTVK